MKRAEKFRSIMVCLLAAALFLCGCGAETEAQTVASNPATAAQGGAEAEAVPAASVSETVAEESEAQAAFSDSTPENDTDVGLRAIKIDAANDLTDEQKVVAEYFDDDYLRIWSYEAMRRYPQVFDESKVVVSGAVIKVLSMDANQYQLVLWLDVAIYSERIAVDYPDRLNNYLLITGETGDSWFMEGDILTIYGLSKGVETVEIDGISYTIPKIEALHAYYYDIPLRDYIIYAGYAEKFDLPFIKRVAETIFGKELEIRKPVVGTDITEDMDQMYQWFFTMSAAEVFFVVELENQSNAKFTKFLFTKEGGTIQDIKDAMASTTSSYERYIEFAADFQHYFLFTYDGDLEILTLEYYDTDFNKIWKREFMETTSAQYDYTQNNIYLTANNELFIINTETGEDTYPPSYVGSKLAVRKLENGILMISESRSDGVMLADLDGSIKWRANLNDDVNYISGLQIVDERIIFAYEDSDWSNHYVSIDSEAGEILVNAKVS